MSGPDRGDHYYRHQDVFPSEISYADPGMIPQRRPVGSPPNPAQLSPPEQAYNTNPTQTGIPQRKGTINTVGTVSSGGGKFTVSPASSIHEDEEAHREGYGVSAGVLPPSPPRRYQEDVAEEGPGRWGSQTGLWHGQAQAQAQADKSGRAGDSTRAPAAAAGGLWQTYPDESEIPYPVPPNWRGSRDLQELQEARARELESRVPYGPAPELARAAVVPVPEPVRTTPVSATTPAVQSAPAYAPSWQNQQQGNPQSQQTARLVQTQSGQNNGRGPFMHYEDLDYFVTAPESEPKDESQVDAGLPRADTFPPIPEEMNRPEARRSWDRQRRRRRKKMEPGGGNGHGWRGDTKRGGGRGCGDLLRHCMDWLPEIASCLLAIVCLVVIVVVLKTFDGRGLADWPLTVSLNTLVAFLAAICQVALTVPLTEGLSQLKWNSFARAEKPLADFQTFEDAKRGPVGSAMLLCRRKGRALGMTGATALLTGFLLSPLTQGAITYPTRSLEAGSGTAAVARSESYSHPTPYDVLDTREKQAIQSGTYHAVDSEFPPLQPVCSSGDCQWQNFSSLAVCTAVADVSDRLTVSNQARILGASLGSGGTNNASAHEARLPNGLFLVGGTTTYNLNVSWPHSSNSSSFDGGSTTDGRESFLPARTSLAFSEQDGRVSSAIANFFLVYTNQTGELPAGSSDSQQQQQQQQAAVFRAAEVLLHFCVNTYEASTAGGVSTSSVVHTSTLAAEDEAGSALVSVRDGPASSGRVILRAAAASDQDVYSVKREDVKLLNNYLLSLFAGTYSYRYGTAAQGETATSEALGLAMFGRGPRGDEEMRAVVRNLTGNVAASLTNTIRAMSSASASGTVLSTETYVRIQWAWLTFLAIQVVLAVSVLLGIMVQTAVWDVQLLKGSALASLLALSAADKAYLEEQESVALDGSHGGSPGAETAAKLQTLTARFRPRDRGWTLELAKRENG